MIIIVGASYCANPDFNLTMTHYMKQKEDSAEPFNLYLAGNVVHGLTTFLEKISEQCAQKFQTMLSHTLNAEINVMPLVEIEQMVLHANHDDSVLRTWITNGEDPTDLSVIALDRGIITACLDLMCGGTGEYPEKTYNVPPSMGDKRMAYKLLQGIFKSFEESFESIIPVKLRATSKSEDAVAEQIDRSSMDFIVCMYFIISIGDTSGSVQMLIPASAMTSLSGRSSVINRQAMDEQLKHRLLDVSIPMTAKLGQQTTTLRKALSIKPGDIIPLHNPIDADVFVAGKPFGKAQVLTDNNKLMLKIASDTTDEVVAFDSNPIQTAQEEAAAIPDTTTEAASKEPETERPGRRRRNRARSRTSSAESS